MLPHHPQLFLHNINMTAPSMMAAGDEGEEKETSNNLDTEG
jgi:hypothetical protein